MADTRVSHADALIKAVAAQNDISSMLGAITSRISSMNAQEAANVLAVLDADCTTSADNTLAFLALLDISEMMTRLKGDLLPAELRKQMIKEDPGLAEAWSRFESITGPPSVNVRAKISLLMEVLFLLNRELKDSALERESFKGSDLAMKVLADPRPSYPELAIESASFLRTSQTALNEVLDELDFIQKERGTWLYRLDETSLVRLSTAKNITAYRATSARLSPLALARAAENLVKRLGFIVRASGMYPAGHPAIAPSVEGFLEVLSDFHAMSPIATLSLMGGQLMVNDLQVRRKGGQIDAFLKDMVDRNVSSISFNAGIDTDMVLRFAAVFNRSPAYIKDHGGLASLLERREVSNITVDQYRYALVSKDGTVVGGVGGPPAEDTTLENIIFAELVDRLERGDSFRDLPDEQLGQALKKILQDASGGAEKQRNLLANFVAALDPGILEKGLLARRDIQREIAWSALRKIIKTRMADLNSPDEDTRLEAMDRLLDLVVTGIERNKDNTVVQIVETVSQRLPTETGPDALYTGVVMLGTACEALISRGRLSTAEVAADALERIRLADMPTPELLSSRRRAIAEAIRRIDSPEVADRLVDLLLSHNEVAARQAEALSGRLVLRNLTTRLINVFLEPDRHTRAKAYRVLRRIAPRAMPVILAKLKALHTFDTVRDPETGRLNDEDWFICRNLVQILGELRIEESVETLATLTGDPDERIREAAFRSLLLTSPGKAAEVAGPLLRDPTAAVAQVAIDALSSVGGSGEQALRQLLSAFHASPSLRPAVMKAFRRFSGNTSLSTFLRAEFAAAELLPFNDFELAMQALDIMQIRPAHQDLLALRAYIEKVSNNRRMKKKGPERQFLENAERSVQIIQRKLAEANLKI